MTRRDLRRDVFRYTALYRGIILVAFGIGVAGLVGVYRMPASKRQTFILYGFIVFTTIGAGGVVQSLRERIELRDDEIRVVGLVRQRSYARDRVVDVRWAKGYPVSLKLSDGAWAHLPGTGHANTRVAGAIRAWLNEGARGAGDGPAGEASSNGSTLDGPT
jgi:hypothetical protein